MAGWKGAVTLFLEPSKIESELEVQSLFVKLNSLIKEGNSFCADCDSPKITSISVNLGTFLCQKCAMAHMETLKPHVSAILPADTERIKLPGSWIHHTGSGQIIRLLQSTGNEKANTFWEANFNKGPSSPGFNAQSNVKSFSPAIGIFIRPDEGTDNATRRAWLSAKYVKRAFAGAVEMEAIIRLKGKVSRLHVNFIDSDMVLESIEPTGKRGAKIDTISLAVGTIRPYRDPSGELECFDVQTKSIHFQVLECQDLMGLLFWVHRCGCSLFPPKVGSREKGTSSKRSFTRIGNQVLLGMDLSNPLNVTSFFDPQDLSLASNSNSGGSSHTMTVCSSHSLSDPVPETLEITMEEILLKTTEQEMTHLKQEKGLVDGAMTELQFRQRKLQKKLEACNSTLGNLKDKGEAIDTKIGVLSDSLVTFHEAEDEDSSLIEILSEKNPLCTVTECPETTERLLEVSHGEVRCGTLNELINVLTHPELCKPSFRSTFLLTFQSFTDPMYLLSRLFTQFSLSDEMILSMINETQILATNDSESEFDQKFSKVLAADPKAKAFATISARRANELIASKPQPFKVSAPKRTFFSLSTSDAETKLVSDRKSLHGCSTESENSNSSTVSSTTTEKDQDDRTEDTGNSLTEDVISSRAKTPTLASRGTTPRDENPNSCEESDEKVVFATPKRSRSKGKVSKKESLKKREGDGEEFQDSPRKKRAKEKKEGKKNREECTKEEEEGKGEREGKEEKPKETIEEGSNKTKAKPGTPSEDKKSKARTTRSGTNDKSETKPKSKAEPTEKSDSSSPEPNNDKTEAKSRPKPNKTKPRSVTTSDKTKSKVEGPNVIVEEPKSKSRSTTIDGRSPAKPRCLEASSPEPSGDELEVKSKKPKVKNIPNVSSPKGGEEERGSPSESRSKGKARTKSQSGTIDGGKGEPKLKLTDEESETKVRLKMRSSSVGSKGEIKSKSKAELSMNEDDPETKTKAKTRSGSMGKCEVKRKSSVADETETKSKSKTRSSSVGKGEIKGKLKAESRLNEEESPAKPKSKPRSVTVGKGDSKAKSKEEDLDTKSKSKRPGSVGGKGEIRGKSKAESSPNEEGLDAKPKGESRSGSGGKNEIQAKSKVDPEGDEGELEAKPKSKGEGKGESNRADPSSPPLSPATNKQPQAATDPEITPSPNLANSREESTPTSTTIPTNTTSIPNFVRGESFESRGPDSPQGKRELKKRGSAINRRKKSIQKQFKRRTSASTSGIFSESPSVSPLAQTCPISAPTPSENSPVSTYTDDSRGSGTSGHPLTGRCSSPFMHRSSGELYSYNSLGSLNSTTPPAPRKGEKGKEGRGKGEKRGSNVEALVSVGRMNSDPEKEAHEPTTNRRTKRASTLCSAPLPELAANKGFIQPLTIEDFLSDDTPQPDRVEKWRNQIRVRVMNVLRHWLEDHWEDFETHPHLLYQLIKWINDVLIPSGKNSMANALKKSMAKKLESSNAPTNASLIFSKKAPTPILPKTENCELLDHDPVELARQVCLKQQKLYRTICLREFLDQKWNKEEKKLSAPGIVAFIEEFNELSMFVTRSIVMQLGIRKRIKHLEKWIQVATKCREHKNFNGTMAIISGLRASSVFRLKKTWAGIESKMTTTYEQLQELMSQENNWQKYRQSLGSEDPPLIPYLGVYLTDLTFLDDANPNTLGNGAINFEKRRKLADLIEEVHQYQQEPYHFVEVKGMQEELRKSMKEKVGGGFSEQDLFNFSLIVEPKGS